MRVINFAERGLRKDGKRFDGVGITVMDLACKKDINDPQKSPASKIIEGLVNLATNMRIYGPSISSLATRARVFTPVGSVEMALSGSGSGAFIVGYDMFRGISAERVKGLVASSVVVDEKNLFAGGKGIACPGIKKGVVLT